MDGEDMPSIIELFFQNILIRMSINTQLKQRDRINATLAKNLLLARNACEFNQSELAEDAGISRATVAKIESGNGDPQLSTIVDIATSLDISPMLLLMGEDELNSIIQLIKQFPKDEIPEEDVEKIQRLLSTGLKNKRLKAAKLGVTSTVGSIIGSSVAGAAIGTVLMPGVGTIVGASLGTFIKNSLKSKDD